MTEKFQKLVLSGPEFTIRASNFAHLMEVPSFQKRFFADPAGVAAREFNLRTSTTSASNTNAMIFALLNDKKFNDWAKEFQKEIDSSFKQISQASTLSDAIKSLKSKEIRDQLISKFNNSIIQHLSSDTANTLNSLEKGPLVAEGDVAIILLTFIALIVVITIAAGVQKPEGLISRRQIRLVVQQLTESQLSNVPGKIR